MKLSLVHSVALALTLSTTAAGEAQQAAKTHRIGFIGFHSPGLEWGMLVPFQKRLHELGWVEGDNLSTSYRWADSQLSRYPSIVSELVESDVDLMVIPCGRPLRAVRELRLTLPVVARCIDLKDFAGEIETLDRPGGHTTGVTYFSPGATARRLELLKQALPGLSHVGLLYRPRSDWTERWADVEAAVRSVGLGLHRAEWRSIGELSGVFDQAIGHRVGALLTLGDGATHYNRHHIFALAAERRLPVLYDFPMFPAADEVGLMSYYVDVGALFRAVAEQVNQILKGAKPGDIPVERPEKFRFVINQRAARALGLSIFPSLLRQANGVLD